MMYSEFLKGTGAPENSKTYEQFLKIEQIYMDCDHMSKEKAYRLWKSTYGKEAKLAKKEREERISRLAMPEEQYQQLPEPDQIRIGNELHELFWNAYYNRDNSTCQVSKDNMCFIDRFGIVWFVKRRDVRWFCYDYSHTVMEKLLMQIIVRDERRNGHEQKEI